MTLWESFMLAVRDRNMQRLALFLLAMTILAFAIGLWAGDLQVGSVVAAFIEVAGVALMIHRELNRQAKTQSHVP